MHALSFKRTSDDERVERPATAQLTTMPVAAATVETTGFATVLLPWVANTFGRPGSIVLNDIEMECQIEISGGEADFIVAGLIGKNGIDG